MMKKYLLLILFFSTKIFFNAQCTTSVTSGTGALNYTYAFITGQSFKAACTAKLNNITFPAISNTSDDLRGSGYSVGVRIKDSGNTVLANGFWQNGSPQTELWYPGATVVADFQCSDLTLQSGYTYIWEVYAIPGSQSNIELILFTTRTGNPYPDGNYIKDGIAQTSDIIGWTVNLTSTVVPLAASQSQINPSSSASNDGSATVSISGGISGAPTTYVWKKNGTVISGANTNSISNLSIGNYTCEITRGCTLVKSFTLTANSLAIAEAEIRKNKIYPNPASEFIYINASEKEIAFVYAPDGRLVKSIELQKGVNRVSISDLSDGNYLVKMRSGSTKLIKN